MFTRSRQAKPATCGVAYNRHAVITRKCISSSSSSLRTRCSGTVLVVLFPVLRTAVSDYGSKCTPGARSNPFNTQNSGLSRYQWPSRNSTTNVFNSAGRWSLPLAANVQTYLYEENTDNAYRGSLLRVLSAAGPYQSNPRRLHNLQKHLRAANASTLWPYLLLRVHHALV